MTAVGVLGAVLVVAAASAMGWVASTNLTRRPAQLAELIRLLESLERNIGYGRTQLAEALAWASAGGSGPAAAVLAEVAAELADSAGRDPRVVWGAALARSGPRTAFSSVDLWVLLALGAELGRAGLEDERARLAAARVRLEEQRQRALVEQARGERLLRYAGVLGGLAAVLIFS